MSDAATDCPPSPCCGLPSVPANGGLWCVGCGGAWTGTPKQMEQALAAERAWEAQEKEEAEKKAEEAWTERAKLKLARLREGRW